jgi:hypothetical protein
VEAEVATVWRFRGVVVFGAGGSVVEVFWGDEAPVRDLSIEAMAIGRALLVTASVGLFSAASDVSGEVRADGVELFGEGVVVVHG